MDFFRSLRSSQPIGAKALIQSQQRTKVGKRKANLCKLLIAKYKRRFGKSVSSGVIVAQVNRFVDTMPLTGRNLEILEQRILAAAGQTKGKKVQIAESARQDSQHTPMEGLSDNKQNQENVQQNEEVNRREFGASPGKAQDEHAAAGESSVPMTEDEEWDSIMKYNQQLYKEEARQEQLKKQREKRYLMNELRKQMSDKEATKKAMEDEETQYVMYQTDYLRKQREQDQRRDEERRRLVLSERELRDRQLAEEAIRRQMEEEEGKEQDRRMVERMREETEAARRTEMRKKELQREITTKMVEESLRMKELQKVQEVAEKEQDVARQKRQQEIAEMQEREWKENMRRKDERNRLLMENSQKTGGAKAQREEAELEDRRMREQMRIMNDRKDEEERIKLLNREEAKRHMQAMLERQMEDRQRRKNAEAEEDRSQALMWQQENELFRQQEEASRKRQEEFKRRHQDYLMNQMVKTRQANNGRGMTYRDKFLNKKIIEDMKVKQAKLRASTGFK